MRWLKEPTLHFLLIGLAIFLGDRAINRPPSVIVVPAELRAALGDEAKVQAWVDKEILYREAVARGLADGDPIVRRRLVQKMEFQAEDAPREPPDDAALRAHLAANAERFRKAARFDFEHRFFRRGRGDEAERALPKLRAGESVPGEPFVHGGSIKARSVAQLAALFGLGFAERVAGLPLGEWAGPVDSAHGRHLVRVARRVPGAVPELKEVRRQVAADLAQARAKGARAEQVKALRARYEVRFE